MSKHPLIEESKILVSAGVWDVLSAKIAERAGFHTVVLSGYAVSASYLGEPDFGLLTQSEILDVARRICRAVSIRVIVDGDTGFGGPLNVIHMVESLIQMGAAGVILEAFEDVIEILWEGYERMDPLELSGEEDELEAMKGTVLEVDGRSIPQRSNPPLTT